MGVQGIDYHQLCRGLTEKLIPEATEMIKTHIDLDHAISPPGFIVGQAAKLLYDMDYRAVCIPSKLSYSDEIDLFVSVGEEVGHYLHHQVRPDVFAARETARNAAAEQNQKEGPGFSDFLLRYFAIANYIESVGQYAGLVFAERNSDESRVKHYINTDLAEQISQASNKLNARSFEKFDDAWEALTHMFGYALAVTIYEQDKVATLKELFFLPPEKFGEVCERYQVQNIQTR